MSAIILGLQYNRRDNFPAPIVHDLPLTDRELQSLQQELNRRYPEWLHQWPAQREVTLNWSCPELPRDTRYGLLVAPSENERFKNLYLIVQKPSAVGFVSIDDTWLETIFQECVGHLETLITKHDSPERSAIEFVLEDLRQLLQRDSPQAALLLFLGAVGLFKRVYVKSDPRRGALYQVTQDFLFEKCKVLLQDLSASGRGRAE